MKENGFPRLKQFRLEMGMNQKDFANSIGLNLSTYNNYETGAREPSSDFWVALSHKYKVSVDFLLGLHEKSPAPAEAETGELAQDDLELLEDYHKLNESGREAARNAVRGLTFAPNLQQLKERHSVEMADIADDAIRTIDKLTELTSKNQNNLLRKK